MKSSEQEGNKVIITFESLHENIRIMRTIATVYASVEDPTMEKLSDFKTAVSEALTNAVIHAYKEEPGLIRMTLEKHNNEIWVIVEDYGVGMDDVKKYMEPMFTTAKKEERSGMGFTFMEAFSDYLSVESKVQNGTRVFMKKKMKEDESGEYL